MIKGVDLSSIIEIEKHGGKYYLDNKETDILDIMKYYDINLIRLRLFNDPYDEDGNSYGCGKCDLDNLIEIVKRINKVGIDWYLDFHYSDAWADPGKQIMPKAWKNINYEELVAALYEYTKYVLIKLKELNYDPKIISIGNEITSGMCWPIGHIDNRENLIGLINSGIKAVKEIMPSSKIMLHLDNGGNNELYRDFFDKYFDMGGLDFDYIGLSYYPLWHGSLQSLKNNLDDLANRYNKDLLIVETSFPFSKEDYKEYERLDDDQRKGMASKKELLDKLDIEVSKDGQIIYMDKLINIIKSINNNRCKGFVYWGGESIPVKGVYWATYEGIKYMNEKGPLGNEWANQALFDYDGNSLPVLNFIKNIK